MSESKANESAGAASPHINERNIDEPHNDQPHRHPMGRLAARFYSDRRLLILTIVLAVASGASSLMVLPRMEDPMLTQRAANITTVFPGAHAERVEALVTEKIEDKLLDIPEIKRMRSQSRAGSSFISIELRDDVYDTDPVWSAIRGKLEDSISSLPAGAQRPEFNELDIAAYAWIGAIVWDRSDAESSGVLRRLARELKDKLFAVEGTKDVDLFGDPLEEIVVEIVPEQAAASGLSAAAIAQQLSRGDVKTSAGMLRGEDAEIVVELENQFRTMEDILSVSLQTNQPGQSLSLTDVASVRRTTPEPAAARALIDGRPGVVVSVMLRPEYRIDHWSESAEEVIQSFASRLPEGISLDVIMQQDRYVAQRMRTLARNLFLGVMAVGVVTFIFMGWRSSLLVTATLPVAALMVIAGMRFLGIPIHQMSITGLIIALGLLIDNAIIAADEIDISLRRGLSPKAAVGDMVSRLFAPLLASTITTALAFAPIALMEGPAGEFVGSIAVTVMLAIFSSLFLAMTVLPATAALLQRGLIPGRMLTEKADPAHNSGDESADHATGSAPHIGFFRQLVQHGISIPAVTRGYRRFLHAMLARPWTGIALGSVLPIAGFVAATQLSEQFFPPADRDQFYIELELAPQATMARTEQVARRIDARLKEETRVQHTAWFLGESAPPFYYNIIARRKNSPNYGQAIVTLDNNRNALELIRRLQLELDAQFPSARLLVRQLEQGPPFDAPVEVRLFGSDLDQLKQLGEEVRSLATKLPNVLHARTLLSETRPVASIDVDARQASWTGLSEADVAEQLYARLEGLYAGTIIEEVEEIPVRVRIANSSRDDVESLSEAGLMVSAPLRTMNDATPAMAGHESPAMDRIVPVSSIAKIQLKPQRAVITRYNGRRMNEVQSFITAGTLPSQVLDSLRVKLAESGLDKKFAPGSLEFGGEASERDAAVSRLMANVSVLAVGMVASLVLALASFRLAALIGVVATLSIGLGMGALWLFGYPFGFMAIIGTMGLIGIAINDSIVVVAALEENRGAAAGEIGATVDTTVEITRHVLATTATTVVGFLPLVLSGGGFWPPLAVAIGTGVTGATIISLTLVPSAFRLMARPLRA
jgi:multidrug efflux pump subunit AcrB